MSVFATGRCGAPVNGICDRAHSSRTGTYVSSSLTERSAHRAPPSDVSEG